MESLLEQLTGIEGRPDVPIEVRGLIGPSGLDAGGGPRLRPLVEDIVADVFGVETIELRMATRGKARAALARQVAMYLAHVGYGLSLTEVGELFERDRTTVAHACSIVERRRDDRAFDAAVVLLELTLKAVVGAMPGRQSVDCARPGKAGD